MIEILWTGWQATIPLVSRLQNVDILASELRQHEEGIFVGLSSF
jgi:hypothetical protein